MADLDAPRQSDYSEYDPDVGLKDVKIGATGILIAAIAAIVLAIIA